MIVINCVYSPFLNAVMQRHASARRVLNLTIDLLVDFAIAVIIPICVILPRFMELDWKMLAFSESQTFNDVWLANTISEGRQTLVTSPIDYISSLAPHFVGLSGLDIIKRIIQRYPPEAKVQPNTEGSSPLVASLSAIPPLTHTSSYLSREERRTSTRYHILYTIFTTFWAVGVITLHVLSFKHTGAIDCCELYVNAWLSTKLACSVVQINCHRYKITGARDELEVMLASFEAAALTKVTFSHCAALHIPPIVTTLRSLRGIEIYNSTLVSWPDAAKITSETTPILIQMTFINTNFSVFPEGLLHADIPKKMAVMIHRSNLSELPSDIGDIWEHHYWPYFSVEYSKLRVLPASFRKMQLHRLSLVYNALERLDDDAFVGQELYRLRLSGNPLTSLPPSFGSGRMMQRVALEYTNLTALTPWLLEWWREAVMTKRSGLAFSLHGSPVCTNESNQAETVLPADTSFTKQRVSLLSNCGSTPFLTAS
ncbi:hypothetical protein PINS_up013902 [Pythium insidiosum]|nr:hypothetical protein PINS_up013902 [Pythium insidiosum]